MERFEAEKKVVITNDKEKVQGDFGVYLVDKETATLQGNVKISQGNNFIIGEVADINMKTGVSRLQMLSEKGKPKGQVRGVFVPDGKNEKKAVAVEKQKAPAVLRDSESGDGHESNEKLLSSSDERE